MLTLAIAEFLLVCAAVYVAGWLRFAGQVPATEDSGFLWLRALVFGLAGVVGLTAMGLYQSRQRLRAEGTLVRMGVGLGFAALALTVVYYFLPVLTIGRGWWLMSFVAAFVLVAASRAVFSRLVDQDVFRRRVLVYGAGKTAAALLQLRRRSDQRGFKIVAFLPAGETEPLIDDERVERSSESVVSLASTHGADEIVIAMDDRRQGFPIKELLDCKFAGIDVIDILTFLERESGKVKVDLMSPSWLIFSAGFTQRSTRVAMSRVLDLAVSIAGALVTWPIMLLTAVAILLDDGWPVLYRQTRVGLLGRNFELLKFRSMTKDAETVSGPQWAQTSDGRVTRVGGVIRKLRIDELPQLFNIIRGDMRLVGPRPERPEFVKELAKRIPYYHERHCVKPGLTGWAQLCYRYGSSEKDALEKLQFDLYYVKNQSLIFDLMILLQTVEVVLWGKGAR